MAWRNAGIDAFWIPSDRDNRRNLDENCKVRLISGLESRALVVESRRTYPGENSA